MKTRFVFNLLNGSHSQWLDWRKKLKWRRFPASEEDRNRRRFPQTSKFCVWSSQTITEDDFNLLFGWKPFKVNTQNDCDSDLTKLFFTHNPLMWNKQHHNDRGPATDNTALSNNGHHSVSFYNTFVIPIRGQTAFSFCYEVLACSLVKSFFSLNDNIDNNACNLCHYIINNIHCIYHSYFL